MPWKAPTPCCKPGCPEVVNGRFCDEHQIDYDKKRNHRIDSNRPSAAKRGYDARWRRARRYYLRRNPLCVEHKKRGEYVSATVIDHIVPHKGDSQLFWDESNWQSLCKKCHDQKTAREDGGFGNNG